MDQGRKFEVQELEAWQAEKGIKIEFSIAYSSEMNGIAERTNNCQQSPLPIIWLQSRLVFLGQSFWYCSISAKLDTIC